MYFQLSYAGIPLLIDTAKVIRMPPPEVPHGQEEKQQPIRQQQPECDLIDEVNRLIRLNLIQDQAFPGLYSDRNVSNLARKWPILDWPETDIEVGDWFYPWGATRWSVFRGLASSTMVKAILDQTLGANPATFVMQAAPISPNNSDGSAGYFTLASDLYMLPPRPLGEHGGGFDGLYLITLVDERFYWQGVNTTFRINQNTTWTQLFQQLVSVLNLDIDIPDFSSSYTIPEADSQLWANEESAALLLDALCYNLGYTLVRNLDGSYALYLSDQSRQIAYANRSSLGQVVRLAGGDLFSSGEPLPVGNLTASKNSVLPQYVTVNFPKYIIGNDPVPHFLNPRFGVQRPSSWYEDSYGDTYAINVPLLSGGITSALISGYRSTDASGLIGVSGFQSTHRTTAKALYLSEATAASGNLPINNDGLTALAMQIANDTLTAKVDVAFDEVYPGTFSWTPEGVHDIIWSYTTRRRKACTRVNRSQWNRSVTERQNATPIPSSYPIQQTSTPPGAGGPSVPQTWRDSASGSLYEGNPFSTSLGSPLGAADTVASINAADYLPINARWYAQIDEEILQLEGTSGGVSVSIVQRGINGTVPAYHLAGASVTQLLDVTYGVNLVTYEKNQFVVPAAWRSGGIQGVRVIPQTQSVLLLSSEPLYVDGIAYYSGRVTLFDPTAPFGSQFVGLEYAWIVPRSNTNLFSGKYYDGTFAGYSQTIGGSTGLIYLIDEYGWQGGYLYPSAAPLVSGVQWLQFDPASFALSGYQESGTLQIYGLNKLTVENIDGTNVVSGPSFIYARNLVGSGFDDTHDFGRIFWNKVNSGPDGDVSGKAGYFSWQGLRGAHLTSGQTTTSGIGYVGPEPDLEFLDSPTVMWTISDADGSIRIYADASASGSTGLTSGSVNSGVFASGTLPAAINADGTQYTNPCNLFIADNDLGSGYQFGRIYFQNLASGNSFQSGIGLQSGNSYPNAVLIDWQGLRVYKEGEGYYGPEPDLELVDGSGIKWYVSNDVNNARIRIGATTSGRFSVNVRNTDGTNLISGVTLIQADNSFSGYLFQRIYWSLNSGTAGGWGQLDWQGFRVYKAGVGYVGPEPDLEVVDSNTITWTTSNNIDNQTNQIRPEALALLSGITFTLSGPFVTSVTCQSGNLSVTTMNLTMQFVGGVLVSGYWA